VALCALGLMYVPDSCRALQEQHRLLKPGGRAVAAVWGQRDRCGWAEIFPIADARVQSEVCPMFFQLGTKDVLQQTFHAAGLADVTFERLPSVLSYGSADEALGAAFLGGPVALAYSRFDDRTRDEVHAEYLASIEPYRNGAGYDVPGEFVIAAGYKR
jgi:SAM-dependent methyltransferase